MKKLSLILMFFILNGCNEKNYTVDYFNAHSEERKLFLKKCANGEIDRNSQNCENARLSQHYNPFE